MTFCSPRAKLPFNCCAYSDQHDALQVILVTTTSSPPCDSAIIKVSVSKIVLSKVTCKSELLKTLKENDFLLFMAIKSRDP